MTELQTSPMSFRSEREQDDIDRATKLRDRIAKRIFRYEQEPLASIFGSNAARLLAPSFAPSKYSTHWFTQSMTWGALLKLLGDPRASKEKDGPMLFPGPLKEGLAPEGTRKTKENVHRQQLLIYDFDKGDAPIERLEERMKGLRIECGIIATHSHLKDSTKLAWSTTSPDASTGNPVTSQSPFQIFVREHLGIGEEVELEPSEVTGEIAKLFMVHELDFDESVLGEVSIAKHDHIETKRNRDGGRRYVVTTLSFLVSHAGIAKSRLLILLEDAVERGQNESASEFQSRWKDEIYDPVGRLIGFKFDSACNTTERGHYVMSYRWGTQKVPLCHVPGTPLDLAAPEIVDLLARFKTPRANDHSTTANGRSKSQQRSQSSTASGSFSYDWLGFLAADAAADTLLNTYDKRSDQNHSLVAFPCPFVHEHATSNDPSARQCYAYNASDCDRVPTVKCQSATCQGKLSSEFLDKLFAGVQLDSRYRIPRPAQSSGVAAQATGCLIDEEELEAKLYEVNKTWAVVFIGGKARYLREIGDGEFELYDEKSANIWFANWRVIEIPKQGTPKLHPFFPYWNTWEHRRQYNGIRFCPNEDELEPGIYNTYIGFAVEPQKGSWKLLLGHIYRNICQKNPKYFRYLIAWLAQLVQQPHIKPGTGIVLKGKEGVGKSKLGEWIVKLFGRHALVVADGERITGRFNAHLENKLFMMAEEAFWAGNKAAEGKLKDLATGEFMSYERKGLDPHEGKNYTRIMIASNEDWVVPAGSGGRRWFVLEVGAEQQKIYPYFAAIDEEMKAGGLEAMLYDLLQSKLPAQVEVRDAPATPWLVEQRIHSQNNRERWVRAVLQEGGFRDWETDTFVELEEDAYTSVNRNDIRKSARRYFAGPKGVDPSAAEIGRFLNKIFGELGESRPQGGGRQRLTVFPPLRVMRKLWLEYCGDDLSQYAMPFQSDDFADDDATSDPPPAAAPCSCDETSSMEGYEPKHDAQWRRAGTLLN